MSSFNASGNAFDLSEQGRVLTYNGNPTYNRHHLRPYIDLDGTGDYLERADEAGLDIQGNEAIVAPGARGITFGAWVYFDTAASAIEYIIAKRDGDVAANIAYSLRRQATGELRITVSSGAAFETQDSTPTLSDTTWYHVVGKWVPSTEISCFVNGTKYTAASALAVLANIGASLQVGGRDNGAGGSQNNMDGRVSMAFLCTTSLPDVVIWNLFQQSRPLFGV
jgi:hypothetical protein